MINDFFERDEATLNMNKGMRQAITHADREKELWSMMANDCFFMFIRNVEGAFLVEDIRRYAKKLGLPDPPSNRAWGAIIKKEAKAGTVVFKGYAKTSNPKAHRTPAALWEKS